MAIGVLVTVTLEELMIKTGTKGTKWQGLFENRNPAQEVLPGFEERTVLESVPVVSVFGGNLFFQSASRYVAICTLSNSL